VCPSICKRERPSVEEHCLPTSKYQLYNLFYKHNHFVPPASALFINCQTWGPLPPRSRFPFKVGPRVATCQTVPAQLKIWTVRVRLFFATAETKSLYAFFLLQTIGSDFARGPECWQARVREWGGGLRQRWLGGALAPVTSAGLQQRSARHRHGRHRGQYTAARWQPRTTPARHSQLASLLPRAVLTRDSSQTPFNTAKNQFNQQRERESK